MFNVTSRIVGSYAGPSAPVESFESYWDAFCTLIRNAHTYATEHGVEDQLVGKVPLPEWATEVEWSLTTPTETRKFVLTIG